MAQSTPIVVAPSQPLSDHHDALVLTGNSRRLYHFAHVPKSPNFNAPPVELRLQDEGFRKVVNLAEGDGCHMALATLPIREEPAAEFLCCYLTNTGRLTFNTPWVNQTQPTPPDLVIINSNNKVFHFESAGQGYASRAPAELGGSQSDAIFALVGQPGAAGDTMAVALVPETANPTHRPVALINAPRLDFVNPWTSAAWAQHPAIPLSLDAVTDFDARVVLAARPDTLFDVRILGGQAIIRKVVGADEARIKGLLRKGMVLGGVTLSDAPGAVNLINLPALRPGDSESTQVQLLLATATGSILNLDFDPRQVNAADTTVPLGAAVALDKETEVWRLLRNGCIAGKVTVLSGPSLLVNLSAFSPATVRQNDDPEKYSGTYDFRWKLGSTLRIVVQKPTKPPALTDDEFLTAVKKIERLANSWVERANLSVVVSVGDTPLALGTPYDILVNLENLPETIHQQVSGQKTTKFPSSDLGSYASRQSFGVPTMYLGWLPGLNGSNGQALSQSGYFASDAFVHIVLHEFGHALGLPNLHQHPDLINPFIAEVPNGRLDRNNLPSFATMRGQVRQNLGVDLDPQTILEQYLLRWPRNRQFSDWPQVPNGANGIAPNVFLDSVMMALPVRGILVGHAPGPLVYRNTLSDFDKDWLAQVYPKK